MADLYPRDLSGSKLPVRFKNVFSKFDKLNEVRAQNEVRIFTRDAFELERFCGRKFGIGYDDLSLIRYRGYRIVRYDP